MANQEHLDIQNHKNTNGMDNNADILIVTITEMETYAVFNTFEQATGSAATPCIIDEHIYFNLGIINDARVFLIRSEIETIGIDLSLLTMQKGIEALKPSTVIMTGIAFGENEKKQAIGDILVTEQLLPYEVQRNGTAEEENPRIVLRGDKSHSSPWLVNQCNSASLLWKGAKVHFGSVLTGEKLDDNVDFRDQLIIFEQEAIGLEMEGGGLSTVCQEQKVDWIVVKAIYGWADGHKSEDKESRQKIAAGNAAAFVLHVLQIISVDWKKKRSEIARAAMIITNIDLSSYINSSPIIDIGEVVDASVFAVLNSLPTLVANEQDDPDWLVILQKEIERLTIGKVTFNPPDTMKCGATERIEARIAKSIETDLITTLKGRGIPQIEKFKISELMKVRLSGDDFTIAPLNEEEQLIAGTGYTEWAWDVTPQKSGKKVLHLHITLRIRLPFGEEKRDHPVLDREVIIKVSPFHSSKLFLVTYWKWVITALILPFIGWTLNTCIKK